MDYLQYFSFFLLSALNRFLSFKPCYKWITFNTIITSSIFLNLISVLNLVINGLPSIQKERDFDERIDDSFKPCYKWITFNTIC